MPPSPASRFVVSDEQVFTTLGSESVILSLADGVYYGLDAVGTRVWALLERPQTVAELTSRISEEFDVSPAQCEHDLLALLGELSARRLVREVPDSTDEALS